MFDIKHLEEVDSTNNTLWKIIKNGEPEEGIVILADFQQSGKGQKGNSWYSERAMNLLASLFLKPGFLDIEKHFYLSKALSLAIVDVLKSYGMAALVKWPNDILVQERKICGILIENALEGSMIKHTVAGIGLNVNQASFPAHLPMATSMSRETNHPIEIRPLLENLLPAIWNYYTLLKQQLFVEIDDLYRKNLFGYERWLTYRDDQGVFQGQIINIRPDGAVGIKKKTGTQKYYYFKEVEWLSKG